MGGGHWEIENWLPPRLCAVKHKVVFILIGGVKKYKEKAFKCELLTVYYAHERKSLPRDDDGGKARLAR